MEKKLKYTALSIISIAFALSVSAQDFLHSSGNKILDPDGQNFIIRSIGTGNWMIQEGYMMGTAGVAPTQHEFREKLEQIIGKARTDTFYMAWLNNHFTRQDVDSMAAWGFNAVRPALHYKWFTLPIEDEAISGENTWLETGFALTDSLVEWCSSNEMYVIFDMHGAPGGQGTNADISDYDPSKPSLWESDANKSKLVALWYKIAERYSDERWVGGYDLINETNWTFPEGNNSPLRDLYERITDTIRLVDQNHIIFIEGNWFANDFSGLVPPWDDNMVYSFHKYWTYNTPGSLDYGLWVRDQYDVPVWLGESGENSNTWFTNLIGLCEKENIGWSWWPVKKMSVNNVLRVKRHEPYDNLIEYWKGNAEAPIADQAYDAVMQFAENHHISNCKVQYDVIDAMIRQPHTKELKAYKKHTINDIIFATDYALGRNAYAYYDKDTANYSGNTDVYTQWNTGWQYRNDGVDIEACSDSDTTNGYNVGWTNKGEFLVYPVSNSESKVADVVIRAASGSSGAYVVLEADGKVISDQIYLPATGAWSNWRSNTCQDIIIPEGNFDLKVRFSQGGANLNYIKFQNIRSVDEATFRALLAETDEIENIVKLHLNKAADNGSVSISDFTLRVNSQSAQIIAAEIDAEGEMIIISTSQTLQPDDILTLSYSGTALQSGGQTLSSFTNKKVHNRLLDFTELPGRMQAEDYYRNQGFVLEPCLDEGGGENTGYANPGDILEYILNVPQTGLYKIDLRVALQNGNAQIEISHDQDGGYVDEKEIALMQTGGWQTWQTQPTSLKLPRGKVKFRLKSLSGEFNLNWLEFSLITSIEEADKVNEMLVFPNPADNIVKVIFSEEELSSKNLRIFTVSGKMMERKEILSDSVLLDVKDYPSGIYFLVLRKENITTAQKLMIN